MNTAMCVAYASDDGYAGLMGISMLSLFITNEAAQELRVFVLDFGISEDNRQKLTKTAGEYGREIEFLRVDELADRLPLNMGARKISIVSYMRLFLSSLLPPQYDRVLYLDCDTIICDDIGDMYRTDMGDSYIAGVQDTVDAFFLKAIGMEEGCRYVNAGVLLINLAAWRADGLEAKLIAFIEKFGGNVPHHDQGVINGSCGMRRKILPLRYNVFSNIYSFTSKMIRKMYSLNVYYDNEELLRAREAPAILHFTTGLLGRPWEENCKHPQKDKYLQAAKKSMWSDIPLRPDGMKTTVKIAAFVRRVLPDGFFAAAYHSLCWLAHLRK